MHAVEWECCKYVSQVSVNQSCFILLKIHACKCCFFVIVAQLLLLLFFTMFTICKRITILLVMFSFCWYRHMALVTLERRIILIKTIIFESYFVLSSCRHARDLLKSWIILWTRDLLLWPYHPALLPFFPLKLNKGPRLSPQGSFPCLTGYDLAIYYAWFSSSLVFCVQVVEGLLHILAIKGKE